MPATVLISGATGFIALHTIKQLLEKGYIVVGTVRNDQKGKGLEQLLQNENFSYEVVPRIEEENAFDSFVKNHPEATVFIHPASPFLFEINSVKDDLLVPAVNGTVNALLAIQKYGPQISRVVVTSSYVAMADYVNMVGPQQIDNEQSWNKITWEESLENSVTGYVGSKKFAEKAAWDFVEKEKPTFALAVVNPVFVFGPQPFDEQAKSKKLNTSSEIINSLTDLTSKDDLPQYSGFAVDVRDVAAAHIAAFEKELAKNQRLFLVSGPFNEQTILDVLHEDFPEQTKNAPVGTPGSDAEEFKKNNTIDNKHTLSVLGFKLRTVHETIHDSVEQIYRVRNQ